MIRQLLRKFSTINKKEMENFDKINDWWDPNGSSKGLHSYNPVRLNFIKKHILSRKKTNSDYYFLDNLNILDIGSGGGLLSESMARFDGKVLGIDSNKNSMKIAETHLENFSSELKNNLQYKLTSIEKLIENKENIEKYDIVTSMEVIEHVNEIDIFLEDSVKVLKKGGIFFLSSLNKGILSYFLTIIMAEKVLGIVPNGTHNYDKYLEPDFLEKKMKELGLDLIGLEYFLYDPINNKMEKDSLAKIQYCMAFEKLE